MGFENVSMNGAFKNPQVGQAGFKIFLRNLDLQETDYLWRMFLKKKLDFKS